MPIWRRGRFDGAIVIDPQHANETAFGQRDQAHGSGRNDQALKKVDMQAQVMGQCQFDDVGMGNDGKQLILVLPGQFFNGRNGALLDFDQRLSFGEAEPAGGMLDNVPGWFFA